ESDRAARRLRRGETLRGGDDHGVSPPAPRRYQNCSDLQHVRFADAPARWTRRTSVYRPGVEWPTAQRLRRRLPDALILLSVRFDRRDFQTRDERFPRTSKSGESARDDD